MPSECYVDKRVKYFGGSFSVFPCYPKVEIFLGQRLRITFGFRSYFFPLDARQTFGWNVTDSVRRVKTSTGLHFSLVCHSRKSWLLGHGTGLSVYPSAEVKNLKYLIIHLKINLCFEVHSPRAFWGSFQWSLFYKYFQNFVIVFIPT